MEQRIQTENEAGPPADRAAITAVPVNNRSRITNGALGVDGRSATGRRWRDVYRATLDATSGRHEQLARSYASMVLGREQLDAKIARGDRVDVDALLRLTSEIRRTSILLGLVGLEDIDDGGDPVENTKLAVASWRAEREAAR